ncbi:MAG: hypothetical protein K0S56_1426 [Microvirga sp.]|jgi:DNA-directed RNA polymerase specialized sigma24 family protein|nr:hypothetical protein [Microvirga sp.]
MNIRTQTDIDHAIAAACDLHDLHAGQTGTRRAPSVPNYDQPADAPVVEFTAEEEDRGIGPRMTAFRALMDAEDFKAADALGLAILALPARSAADLAAKHEVMVHAFIDELPDEYRQLFRQYGAELRQARHVAPNLADMAGRVRSAIRLAKLALDDGQSRGDEWNLVDDALAFAAEKAEKLEDAAFEAPTA